MKEFHVNNWQMHANKYKSIKGFINQDTCKFAHGYVSACFCCNQRIIHEFKGFSDGHQLLQLMWNISTEGLHSAQFAGIKKWGRGCLRCW